MGCTTIDKKEGDWRYQLDYYIQNAVTITGYKGRDTNIEIPSEIRGMPVVDISLRALEGGYWNNKDKLIIGHQLTSVIIPDSVITISQYAFALNLLTSIVIPDNVEWIGVYAFAGNKLTRVIIGNSVESIDYGAFQNDEINELSLPNSLVYINSFAFADNQITNLIIPDSVTKLTETAFVSNPVTCITIGENVEIGSELFWRWQDNRDDNFGSFIGFYIGQGQRAGTYIFEYGYWAFDN
jgi:hypothetical protein